MWFVIKELAYEVSVIEGYKSEETAREEYRRIEVDNKDFSKPDYIGKALIQGSIVETTSDFIWMEK